MASSSATDFLYQGPNDNSQALKDHFIGQKLKDLQAPCVILDRAVIKQNCDLMLDTAKNLGVQFRAHIKTHKTIEGTALQVGAEGPIRIVVSTVAELIHVLPYLKSQIAAGREINVLYGVPAAPSSLTRMAALAKELGSMESIAFMVDHPSTLDSIARSGIASEGNAVPIFIKIDTGYHRAGVTATSETLKAITQKLQDPTIKNVVKVLGLYSHLGHSYAFSTPLESLEGLMEEYETIRSIAEESFSGEKLTLTVGATPTATAAQMLANAQTEQISGANAVKARWDALKSSNFTLELHAGVYPFLDMQQLATSARISNLSHEDVGVRVLAEVASLYSERAKPEALIAAGSLALGREPCKAYSGWGVVTPWSSLDQEMSERGHYSYKNPKGWIVGRISQEHGLLTWEGERAGMRELRIGEKVTIWPNHACVAGSGYGWYFIVDSSDESGGEVVRDVWVRCRGW